LDDADTRTRFAGSIETMQALFDLPPALVACDTHPDYHTTHVADRLGSPVRPVPHHLAHVRACMLDNEIDGPVLGIAWDGTGHGGDGTIWGGECLAVDRAGWHRAAHLLPFRLPGGAAAIREPRRAALGVLHAAFGPAGLERSELDPVASFRPADRSVLAAMVEHGINAPVTSSMGRLFDAVASCLGLCQVARFEGEAAMAVEFAAEQSSGGVALPPFALVERDGILVLDWRALLAGLVEGRCAGRAVADLAAGFHAALAGLVVAVAERIGIRRVLLTGGCFQNARLTALALDRLDAAGFEAYRHRRIPPNDGGLAAGQAAAAGWPVEGERR
jgi:hydrogenase maturation protein HypF